jgi:hypothetical protein
MVAIARAQQKRFDAKQYNTWVKKIQDLKNQGATCELEALRALLAFEKTPLAWRASPGQTFADLLKNDKRLFPVSRWRSFKRATKELPAKTIDSLGVQVACLIAAQPKRQQFGLISKAKGFRKKNGVDATYQFIGEILKKRRPKKVAGPSRIQLMKYIETLKAKLDDNGIPHPTEPWV